MKRLVWASLLTATAVLPACSPWDYGKGDFFAGTVDGTNYPSFYTGGTVEKMAGKVPGIHALVPSGKEVITYDLTMPDSQVGQGDGAAAILGGTLPEFALATEPVLADLDDGNGPTFLFAPVSPAIAYSFDATAAEPFSSPAKCVAPKNYVFDSRVEGYRLDYQGPIFSTIPQKAATVGGTDPAFVPYWAEVAVQSKGEPCQQLKDEDRLRASKLVTVPTKPADPKIAGDVATVIPSGKFTVWYPVDPRTNVTPEDPSNGWGAQKWGWYKHYLFAYIDGGYAPTQKYSFPIGTMNPLEFTGFRTQKWFYPSQRPGAVQNDDGSFSFPKAPTMADPTVMDYTYVAYTPGDTARRGSLAGFVIDNLDGGARGEAGYSPICELCEYSASQSDWDAFLDESNPNPLPLFSNIANANCTGTYVYCPQQAASN